MVRFKSICLSKVTASEFLKFFSLISIVYLLFFREGLFFNNFNIDESILFFSLSDFEPIDLSAQQFIQGGFWRGLILSIEKGSLDPGVYSFCLRLWSAVSTQTYFLRGLSAIFFITGLAFLARGLRLRGGTFLEALFFSLVLFLDPLVMNLSYTMRPYAMEGAGALFLIYFLLRFNKSTLKEKYALMAVLSFFMGARYFLWFPCILVLLIEFLYSKNDQRKTLLKTLVLPAVVSFLYLSSFITQLKFANVDYLDRLFLFKNGDNLITFFKDLIFIPILSFPLYQIIKHKNKANFELDSLKLCWFFLSFFIVILALDLFGIYPLHFDYKYTISLHLLGSASVCFFLNDLFRTMNVTNYAHSIVLLVLLSFSFSRSDYHFKASSDLVKTLDQLKKEAMPGGVVFCDEFVFKSLFMLKNVVNGPYQWEKKPDFRLLSSLTPSALKHGVVVWLSGPQKELVVSQKKYEFTKKISGNFFDSLYLIEAIH